MDEILEQSAKTPVLSETAIEKQPSSDHCLNSDKTIVESISSDVCEKHKKPFTAAKSKNLKPKSIKWQDREESSKHIDKLVGDPLQNALLKEVFFSISEDDLKGGRKKRSPVVKKFEENETKKLISSRERLINTKEAEIKRQAANLEGLKKKDLIGLIHNYEQALKYKTKFKDIENLNIKDNVGEEFLTNLDISILKKKAEAKILSSMVKRYQILNNSMKVNDLFENFANLHGNTDTKLEIDLLLDLKKELDGMSCQLNELYESEIKFFSNMLDEADAEKAKSSLKEQLANIFYPKVKKVVENAAEKRGILSDHQLLNKPVKKQKKDQLNPEQLQKAALLAEQQKRRKEYEDEIVENFMDSHLLNVSAEHPMFFDEIDDVKTNDNEIIHYYDVLGKTTLSAQSRYKSATVDVIVSALFPDITEKYIIHSNANIGTKDNFSIDSLMVIYDLMQLNNIIYFNRKDKKINDLLYHFYVDLCKRNKSLKLDGTKITNFVDMINQYNMLVKNTKLLKKDMLKNANQLYTSTRLPTYFSNFICNYVYGRIVIPEAKKLSKYVGFSDKTYGELLPDFLLMVFYKCQLGYNSNFVDLGCGIGNTNYYASLLSNVKSTFGCEIMENPSDLCVKYGEYFKKIISLFGIQNHSEFNFSLKKSFIDNNEVVEKLKKCDVLLLNNFIFSGDINIAATNLANNLPVGAKIIHLKPLMTMNKDDVNKITRTLSDLNSKADVIIGDKKRQFLKDEDLEESVRKIRDSLRIRNVDGSLIEKFNEDSDNLVEVTKLLLDEKLLVSFKFAMPSGDMVSWTSDNACYHFYISKVVSISELL
ncbi:hypothetical protein ACO0OE_000770 [Hanseniaspora uvarum]